MPHNITDRELAYSKLERRNKTKSKMTDSERVQYIKARWEHFKPRFEDKNDAFSWAVNSIDYDDISFILGRCDI